MKAKKITRIISVILTALVILIACVPYTIAADNLKGVVTGITTYLNVRSGPSTTSTVIGKLYNNDSVTVLGSSGNFYKISYVSGGQTITGYASQDYIKVTSVSSGATDAEFEKYLDSQGFPESYKPALRALHELHPEWIFTVLDTGLDWNTVVKNQMVLGRNLVHSSSAESWKSMEKGAYNFTTGSYVGLDGNSWVAASEAIVKYYLDPRNFLTESTILMFENLSYNSSVQTESNVKTILSNSFMNGSYTTPDTKKSYTYSKTFMDAAKLSGVSPYHLAARALQEQGTNGTSLSFGTVSGYTGYFNFFNIQAYAANGLTAVQNGAKYASTTNSKYSLPWTNQYKAITGGSVWIGTGYIDKLQDTLYLQKFDVVDGGNGYYAHQYMTNVQAAESEAKIMKKAYPDKVFNSKLEFVIPVYKNMPDTACTKPASTASNNNLLDSITVGSYKLNPSFNRYTYSYSLTVPANISSVTLSAKANNSSAVISGIGKITLKEGANKITISCKSPSGLVRNYTVTITREKSTVTRGDATGDGKVNINDVLTIVRYINGLTSLNSTALSAADVTDDGKVNINDALTIVRYINGYITKL